MLLAVWLAAWLPDWLPCLLVLASSFCRGRGRFWLLLMRLFNGLRERARERERERETVLHAPRSQDLRNICVVCGEATKILEPGSQVFGYSAAG